MDADLLVELSDLNLGEAYRELTRRAPGGEIEESDGLLLYSGGHWLPVVVNGALRTSPSLPAKEVLERADDFFASRGRGYTIWVRAHADADLGEAAAAAGLAPGMAVPAMVLGERPGTAPPPGAEIRRVADDAGARDYARVTSEAYATFGMPEDVAPALFARPESLFAPHIASFVAYANDEPVAAAMTVVTHGVAGIYWVGTVPAARGRGLGEAVTRAAVNAGFDLGGRVASLQATSMGEPVYARMGFKTISSYRSYIFFMP